MDIYSFHPTTNEYLGTYTARMDSLESSKVGKPVYMMPSYTTLDPVPIVGAGEVAVRVGVLPETPQGTVWEIKKDHRGKTVYHKSTTQPFTVVDIGDVPDTYTELVPCEHPKWDGEKWAVDVGTLDIKSIALMRTWIVKQGTAPEELIKIEASALKQKEVEIIETLVRT
jgi:hypothetical protein